MSGANGGDPRRLSYAYYTGCVPRQSGRELDVATRLVCERLGIGLREMTGAPCCGAGDVDETRPALNRAVNAVTLAQAERAGLDILTICNVCTLNLRAVNAALRDDPVELARANRALQAGGYSYGGSVEVTHLLWVLYRDLGPERLKAAVARPLRGLATAAFYGCQVLRPAELSGVDDPDDPRSLEAHHRGLRRHAGRLRGPHELLRLADRGRPRRHGHGRVGSDRRGRARGRRRAHRHPLSALSHLARRLPGRRRAPSRRA